MQGPQYLVLAFVVSLPRRQSALTSAGIACTPRDICPSSPPLLARHEFVTIDRCEGPSHILVKTKRAVKLEAVECAVRVSFSSWWRDYFCPFSGLWFGVRLGFGVRRGEEELNIGWILTIFFFLDPSCSINRAEWKRGLNVGAKRCDSGARILSFDHWGRDLGERSTSSL